MATTRQDHETVRNGTAAGTVVALKEWGAAVHALLQGRQTILLRKGGIHEKAFATPAAGGGFVLFPTVAHSHGERTRPEHHDLLPLGAADVAEDEVAIRAGIEVLGVIEVTRPDQLPQLSDMHIWTDQSIQADRVDFRPAKPLQILVVRALALPSPVVLPRLEAYGGCRSWVDVEIAWDGSGQAVLPQARLLGDLERVRRTVGPA
ncbi:MAG TPA: DUF1802 family protein [Euzebya sp.]|nr:DUF1802 family protein [Euzebya sp.]